MNTSIQRTTASFGICLVALFLTVVMGGAVARTLYVSPNGLDSNDGSLNAPFKTIQRAADVVNPGDVVLIKQGIYSGFLIKNKKGQANTWITFKPYNDDQVIIDISQNPTNLVRAVQINSCSYIEIRGITMTDSNPLYDSENPSEYREGLNHEAVHINDREGTPSTHIRIVNNEMYRLGFHGIGAYSSNQKNIEIINNTIYDVGRSKRGLGMYIQGKDHTIRGNVVHDAYGYGIQIQNSEGCIIESNICYNNGRLDYGAGDPVYNRGRVGDGIFCQGNNNIVRNNVCYNNINWGIRVNAPNSTIVNNTVYGNGYQGFYIYDQQNNIIKNNISYGNRGEDGYLEDSRMGTGNIHDHNSWNLNITDPRFVNPTEGDLRLLPDSPAINAGETLSGFDRDITGTPRPQGPFWDIGAYEFSEESSISVSITATPISGPAPLTVNFSGNVIAGSPPLNYFWDFGDGVSSYGQVTSHTFQQIGVYTTKLIVTDNENNQAAASRVIIVERNAEAGPHVLDIKFTEIDRDEKLAFISSDKWYDLHLYVDDPEGWNNISYADLWISHESNESEMISGRGGRFFSASNYIMSLSIETNEIWAKESEGTVQWTNISGKRGLYIDDDHGEYHQNSDKKWAKVRIKLLQNAFPGNWILSAYVINKEGNKSPLVIQNIIIPSSSHTPIAAVTLSDPSPTKAGVIQLTLSTSNTVTTVPPPLSFTESDNSITSIALEGTVPGNTFRGSFIVDHHVADGIGKFSLPANALWDTNGYKGNQIVSGAIVLIDKTVPNKPAGFNARVVGF